MECNARLPDCFENTVLPLSTMQLSLSLSVNTFLSDPLNERIDSTSCLSPFFINYSQSQYSKVSDCTFHQVHIYKMLVWLLA